MLKLSTVPYGQNPAEQFQVTNSRKRKNVQLKPKGHEKIQKIAKEHAPTELEIEEKIDQMIHKRGILLLEEKIPKELSFKTTLEVLKHHTLTPTILNILLCNRSEETWRWKFQKSLYEKCQQVKPELLRIHEHAQMLKNACDNGEFELACRIYQETIDNGTANSFIFSNFILVAIRMNDLNMAKKTFETALEWGECNPYVKKHYQLATNQIPNDGSKQSKIQPLNPQQAGPFKIRSRHEGEDQADHASAHQKGNFNLGNGVEEPAEEGAANQPECVGEMILPIREEYKFPLTTSDLERNLQMAKDSNRLDMVQRLFNIAQNLNIANPAMCKIFMEAYSSESSPEGFNEVEKAFDPQLEQ